jgi:hypothetical protein
MPPPFLSSLIVIHCFSLMSRILYLSNSPMPVLTPLMTLATRESGAEGSGSVRHRDMRAGVLPVQSTAVCFSVETLKSQ